MNIDIDKVFGVNAITRDDGARMYNLLVKNWDAENKITIDFNDRELASISFFDSGFAHLAFKYSVGEIKDKLIFKGLGPRDRNLLNRLLIQRLKSQ